MSSLLESGANSVLVPKLRTMQCFLSLKPIDITKYTSFGRTFGDPVSDQFESFFSAWKPDYFKKKGANDRCQGCRHRGLVGRGAVRGKPRSAPSISLSGLLRQTYFNFTCGSCLSCTSDQRFTSAHLDFLRIWCQDAANLVFLLGSCNSQFCESYLGWLESLQITCYSPHQPVR